MVGDFDKAFLYATMACSATLCCISDCRLLRRQVVGFLQKKVRFIHQGDTFGLCSTVFNHLLPLSPLGMFTFVGNPWSDDSIQVSQKVQQKEYSLTRDPNRPPHHFCISVRAQL